MARRMEIELTSDRGDGTWTWRAAGARQPKGTLEAGLLPPAASVGDVLRAEVEGFLDGLTIVAVLPPKESRPEPERIELLAPRSDGPLVTSRVSRTPRSGRGRGDDRRRERGDRDGRDRDRDRRGRGPRDRAEGGGDRARSDERRGRSERPSRPSTPPPPTKPKPKRLRPGRKHRTTLLESLPAEQQPIAEQLLQGGIPAVRQAIEKQNEELKAAGKPQVKAEPLLDMAERLRHRAQAASWRDRAEAALSHVDDLDLRDLRSVVNAAGDAGRDEESRGVADQLREALIGRVEKEQAAWIAEVAENLQEGRVVRALRLSSRPPKAGSPLPADLSNQLVAATSAALTADTVPQRWGTVLEALAYSPIRRRVLPESLPTKLSSELRSVIARFAVQLPEIAHIFDIEPEKTSSSDRPRPPRRAKKPQRPDKPKSEKKPDKPKAEKRKPAPKAAATDTAVSDEAPTPQPEPADAEATTEAAADTSTTQPEPAEATTQAAASDEAPATEAEPAEATTEAAASDEAPTTEAEPAEATTPQAEQADVEAPEAPSPQAEGAEPDTDAAADTDAATPQAEPAEATTEAATPQPEPKDTEATAEAATAQAEDSEAATSAEEDADSRNGTADESTTESKSADGDDDAEAVEETVSANRD